MTSGTAVTLKDRKRFTDEVLGRSQENRTPWMGNVDRHVSMLCDLTEAFGEQSEQVARYVEINRRYGQSVADGTTEIDTAAEKLMAKDPNLTREAAIVRVLHERPELYANYLRYR